MHTTRDTDLAARRFDFGNLIEAIQQKNTGRVRQLLEKDSGLANMRIHDPRADEDGYHHFAPLHVAAMGGSLEIIGLLINAGADLYAHNVKNDVPFNLALFNNHGAAMLYFKSRGFDPFSSLLGTPSLPIVRAAQGQYDDAALLLIKMGIPPAAFSVSLRNFAFYGRTTPFLKLVADIEATDISISKEFYNKILYSVTSSDTLEIAEFVLQHGAEPDAPHSAGMPPGSDNATQSAVRLGSLRVLRRMIEMGADMAQKCGSERKSLKQIALEHCPHSRLNDVLGLIESAATIRKEWIEHETQRFSKAIKAGGSKPLLLPTRRGMK